MLLPTQPYLEQVQAWPNADRHTLAQYDDRSIVVYQAYRPSIGRWAIEHQQFGGPDFGFGRMSWIKSNFLWMMYRSAWGTSEGQEAVLAIRLPRDAFEEILRASVPSTYEEGTKFASREHWQRAAAQSSVRRQWDPDHHPSGPKLERRAIQLGLRGPILRRYAEEWILEIEDLSAFIAEQRQHVLTRPYDLLVTPREDVYPIGDPSLAAQIGIDTTTDRSPGRA
jgi:hypothetical protein